jgi:acyl-CoA reductase-like NAD-dependent aldehyde dehydrogenase
MWEVGKSLQDSKKEFDRTIKYINDNLAALKDLDRISSRFTIEEGIIGQIRRAPMGAVLCMGPFNYPAPLGRQLRKHPARSFVIAWTLKKFCPRFKYPIYKR